MSLKLQEYAQSYRKKKSSKSKTLHDCDDSITGTETPMLPLMSLQPSVKLSKANSPGLTEKHNYITRQTSSDKVEVEDNLGLEKIEPDLHSKVSGSREIHILRDGNSNS